MTAVALGFRRHALLLAFGAAELRPVLGRLLVFVGPPLAFARLAQIDDLGHRTVPCLTRRRAPAPSGTAGTSWRSGTPRCRCPRRRDRATRSCRNCRTRARRPA